MPVVNNILLFLPISATNSIITTSKLQPHPTHPCISSSVAAVCCMKLFFNFIETPPFMALLSMGWLLGFLTRFRIHGSSSQSYCYKSLPSWSFPVLALEQLNLATEKKHKTKEILNHQKIYYYVWPWYSCKIVRRSQTNLYLGLKACLPLILFYAI